MSTAIVGKITGVHGVRGWLKLISYTSNPADLFNYTLWTLQLKKQSFSVTPEDHRPFGKGFLAKIRGYDAPEVAKSLVSAHIVVERSLLPELPDQQHYWSDLIGFTVETTLGVVLGKISYFFETGANDVFVVQGKKERLIPYLPDQVVKHIDLTKKSMIVDWDPDF